MITVDKNIVSYREDNVAAEDATHMLEREKVLAADVEVQEVKIYRWIQVKTLYPDTLKYPTTLHPLKHNLMHYIPHHSIKTR